MFGAKSHNDVDGLRNKLRKRHRKMLKPGEVFLAACYAYSAAEAMPADPDAGTKPPMSLDASADRLQLEAAARNRLDAVRGAMGMDEDFNELPRSPNGYVLSHTDRRMLIFDGTGRTFMLQAPMKGLWLQPVDHGDGGYTLIFSNGEERVAVATHPTYAAFANDFISSFPDRRAQARTVTLRQSNDAITF